MDPLHGHFDPKLLGKLPPEAIPWVLTELELPARELPLQWLEPRSGEPASHQDLTFVGDDRCYYGDHAPVHGLRDVLGRINRFPEVRCRADRTRRSMLVHANDNYNGYDLYGIQA